MICQGRSAVHAAATNHIACVHVLDDAADSRIKWLKTLGRKVKKKEICHPSKGRTGLLLAVKVCKYICASFLLLILL